MPISAELQFINPSSHPPRHFPKPTNARNNWRRMRKKALRSQPPPPEVLSSLHTNPDIFETAYIFLPRSVFTGLLHHQSPPLTPPPPPFFKIKIIKRYREYLIFIFLFSLNIQVYIEQIISHFNFPAAPPRKRRKYVCK